jgi:hypothetical protein
MPGSVMTVIQIVTLFVAHPTLRYGGRHTQVRSDVAWDRRARIVRS